KRSPPKLLNEQVVSVDQPWCLDRIDLASVYEAHERVAVVLRQKQLVTRLDARILVLLLKKVVAVELAGGAGRAIAVLERPREREKEKRDRCQPLLAVDDLDRV